ncbi:hypothetical protein HYE67_007930 [Fusarium culmorum]|uniref:Zn(2)-C6 fungal-type domain-containing protein n=1 Tax=Fusarium culmorum TaxID=5516 RepID=A0A7S8DBS7_FUSCU|nr:hypothetical protein HYE67_007930 [Fusarium culmorum]
MVGIAGKSKACHDSHQCDLATPNCHRCLKAGIVCRGYERSTLWVHRTQAQPNVSALSAVKDARLEERIRETTEVVDCLHILQQMCDQLYSSNSTYQVVTFRLQALSIADSIYYPLPRVSESCEDSTSTPSSWFKAVCHMPNPNQALDHSLLAFCAIQIRVSRESGISYDDTVQLYNHALSKIISILDSPSDGSSDESLAAIVILSTCELFLFHTSSSWNAHAQGISEMLRNRAVSGNTTQSWSDLCRRLPALTLSKVIQAMVQKRPLILEPHVWRQQIRPPSNPSSFGGLLDLAIDIPSIISNAYELLQSSSSSMRVLSYVEPLIQKFRELIHWRNSYSKEIWIQSEALVYWSVPAQASNPADKDHEEKLFPFALIFSSIASASAWIFASSIMLDILDTILLLHSTNHNDNTVLEYEDERLNSGITPSMLDALLMDANRLSRLLCQSIEFCYRIENGTFGPQITCYAQATLLSYFKHHGHRRELDWCEAIPQMTGPGTSFGINLMQFRPTPDL